MDDTLLFIPPCCVDKKLPRAIMQAPRSSLVFYTHGDVTMEKFYRAVSYLVIDPHVMVLSIPVLQMETAAFLQQCFERRWITDLVLSTRSKAGDMVERFLAPYADHVCYTHSKDVSDIASHLVLYTPRQALIIQGPMFGRTSDCMLAAYTASFIPAYTLSTSALDWGNPLRNALMPDVLRHRQQQQKIKDNRKGHQPDQKSARLQRFLDVNFPPYPEDEE